VGPVYTFSHDILCLEILHLGVGVLGGFRKAGAAQTIGDVIVGRIGASQRLIPDRRAAGSHGEVTE